MKINNRNSSKGFTPIKSGFTLTELLIVVGIITFLGVMITTYLRKQVFKGYDARRKSEINRISIALEEYEKDHDCYPTAISCSSPSTLKPYLEAIPCDPVTKDSYYYEHDGTSCPKWYRMYADLNDKLDKDAISDIGPSGEYNYYASSPNAPKLEESVTPGIYYGCKSGVCTPLFGPSCTTNYTQSRCNNTCGSPLNPLNQCN